MKTIRTMYSVDVILSANLKSMSAGLHVNGPESVMVEMPWGWQHGVAGRKRLRNVYVERRGEWL